MHATVREGNLKRRILHGFNPQRSRKGPVAGWLTGDLQWRMPYDSRGGRLPLCNQETPGDVQLRIQTLGTS